MTTTIIETGALDKALRALKLSGMLETIEARLAQARPGSRNRPPWRASTSPPARSCPPRRSATWPPCAGCTPASR